MLGQLASSIPINPDHHSLRYMLSSNILQQSSAQTGRVPLTQAEVRMLNRLNSAYAKLPSLLESERQRFAEAFLLNPQSISFLEQMPIESTVERY